MVPFPPHFIPASSPALIAIGREPIHTRGTVSLAKLNKGSDSILSAEHTAVVQRFASIKEIASYFVRTSRLSRQCFRGRKSFPNDCLNLKYPFFGLIAEVMVKA